MSSAPIRQPPSMRRVVGRVSTGIAWTLLLAVLAASGAGLASLAWHAPGSPARAELTFAGDLALGARLDDAATQLAAIATDVASLAAEAKVALEEVASMDPDRVQSSLTRGSALADRIDQRARGLQRLLVDLPGAEPDAQLRYGSATLARRVATLAAVQASVDLAAHWRAVGLRASETTNLVALITQHDSVVVDATELGRAAQYLKAAETVESALAIIVTVEEQRNRLIAQGEETVLDAWIDRTRTWDIALRDLYLALRASKGKITVEVQSARRVEQEAFANLPPDPRTILVIIGEVTRGGLTQAVLAIEDAHARLDHALSALASAAASASPAPATSTAP